MVNGLLVAAIEIYVNSFLGIVGSSEGIRDRLEADEQQEDEDQNEEVLTIFVRNLSDVVYVVSIRMAMLLLSSILQTVFDEGAFNFGIENGSTNAFQNAWTCR